MERLLYNGGLDIKEYKKLSSHEYDLLEARLKMKMIEFANEIKKDFGIQVIDVDMPVINFSGDDD